MQGKKLLPEAPNVVPFITFGGLSMVAALLALMLPETGDENLPDTVREAETLGDERMGKMGKQDYDDNTLVRSDDCAQTQYSEVVQYRYFALFFKSVRTSLLTLNLAQKDLKLHYSVIDRPSLARYGLMLCQAYTATQHQYCKRSASLFLPTYSSV